MNETLMARLGLDTTGFKAGLKSANSDFQSWAGKLGIPLSLGGLTVAGRQLIEYGDRINDLSERYKVNSVQLQRLGNIAEQEGSSLEGVAKGFNKLAISQSQALGGNKAIIEAFSALGITTEDLRNLSPEEIMVKIGASSMDAAPLVKLLGKSALELVPTLKAVASGTREFGAAISELDIKKLDEASDALKRLATEAKVRGATMFAQDIKDLQKLERVAEGVFKRMETGSQSFYRSLVALSNGSFKEAITHFQEYRNAARNFPGQFKEMLAARESMAGQGVTDAADFASKPGATKGTATQKELERHQLSLKELQGGAQNISRGPGGKINYATGTAEMQYAAQQARLVEELEQKAKQVRLTGISPTGETAEGLMERRKAILNTLPIKESEKEVGAFGRALDSWRGTAALETIATEMVAE